MLFAVWYTEFTPSDKDGRVRNGVVKNIKLVEEKSIKDAVHVYLFEDCNRETIQEGDHKVSFTQIRDFGTLSDMLNEATKVTFKVERTVNYYLEMKEGG